MLHEAIAGHDPLDSTSLPDTPGNFAEEAKAGAEAARKGDLSGLRVGVIKELGGGDGEGFEAGVLAPLPRIRRGSARRGRRDR